MDKYKDNKHDQLPISEVRHLDMSGHKETLQAGDMIRYTKSNCVGGRKCDFVTTTIVSVHPKKNLVLANNEKLAASTETGDHFNV
eukprot:5240099-Ditylum_brightwellii.AAC.1